MKKLFFLSLIFISGFCVAQKIDRQSLKGNGIVLAQLDKKPLQLFDEVLTPPASASITITINDNGAATLADIRDTLCTVWGYTGSPVDNAAKLAFLKQFLINKIVNDYGLGKGNAGYTTGFAISAQAVVN